MKAPLSFLCLCLPLLAIAQLNFVGAGVMFSDGNAGRPVVNQVLHFSPAEDAGIQVGETLWSVDGKDTEGLKTSDVVSLIKGTEGTPRTLVLGSDRHSVTLTLRRITGKCTDGDCLNGEGRIEEPNGNIYVGNFTNGMFDGYGTYYYYKGETMTARYEGSYKLGVQEGDATFRNYELGILYEGNFRSNALEGEGKVTFDANGATYAGTFQGGKPTGNGMLTYSDGVTRNVTAKSWDDLFEAAGIRRDIAVTSGDASRGIEKTERNLTLDEEGDEEEEDFTELRKSLSSVESKLRISINAYNDFRAAYRASMEEGSPDDEVEYSRPAFRKFLEPYGDAAEILQKVSSTVSGKALFDERQYEQVRAWFDAIKPIVEAYSECKKGDMFSPSACYWANFNVDRFNDLLDEASAHRLAF